MDLDHTLCIYLMYIHYVYMSVKHGGEEMKERNEE